MADFMGRQFSSDRDGACTDIVVRGGGERIIAKALPSPPPEQDRHALIIAAHGTAAPSGTTAYRAAALVARE
jgi:hypothetical protein